MSGVASRREAERLIASGAVRVNGAVVSTVVCFVDENDRISVSGKTVDPIPNEVVVWKYYKPRGVLTSRSDPEGRKTIYDVLPQSLKRLLYVGRLDYNSEGLLLLTNNGHFARQMTLPATQIKRVYRVRAFGKPPKTWDRQININGIRYRIDDVRCESNDKKSSNFWVTIGLCEGKNREIRKIMEYYGCVVNKLIRMSYGGIGLDDMSVGDVRKLSPEEMNLLLKQIKDS